MPVKKSASQITFRVKKPGKFSLSGFLAQKPSLSELRNQESENIYLECLHCIRPMLTLYPAMYACINLFVSEGLDENVGKARTYRLKGLSHQILLAFLWPSWMGLD